MRPVRPTNQGTRQLDAHLPPLYCSFLLPPLMTGSSHTYKQAGNFTYHYIYRMKQVEFWAGNHSFQQNIGFEQRRGRRAELGFSRRGWGGRLALHPAARLTLACSTQVKAWAIIKSQAWAYTAAALTLELGPSQPLPSFPYHERTLCGFQPFTKISSEKS